MQQAPMEHTGQRQARRWKIAIPAAVCDRQRQNSNRCMIHDGSISGCKIVSGQVPKLPDEILINVLDLVRSITPDDIRNGHLAHKKLNAKASAR